MSLLLFKKEDPGNLSLAFSLITIPGRVAHLWKSFPKKDKKIMRTSQHGFTKGKSYLTNLINS